MFATQRPVDRTSGRQGRFRAVLAELQRRGAAPSACDDGFRQRLLGLAQRLERVRALGSEYAKVGWSAQVEEVLGLSVSAV